MIAIIDYGLGNLKSIYNALSKSGIPATVTADKKIIEKAERVILPGVGAFAQGMRNLKDLGLIPVIRQAAKDNKPFLGICLGLQLLFSESEEHGVHKGLGIIDGRVKKFTKNMKIPHMGWNNIKFKIKNEELKILKGIKDNSYFYFVHSYYVVPEDKNIILATTDYGGEFVSMIQKYCLFGVQFHPERSGPLGLEILKIFSSDIPRVRN